MKEGLRKDIENSIEKIEFVEQIKKKLMKRKEISPSLI